MLRGLLFGHFALTRLLWYWSALHTHSWCLRRAGQGRLSRFWRSVALLLGPSFQPSTTLTLTCQVTPPSHRGILPAPTLPPPSKAVPSPSCLDRWASSRLIGPALHAVGRPSWWSRSPRGERRWLLCAVFGRKHRDFWSQLACLLCLFRTTSVVGPSTRSFCLDLGVTWAESDALRLCPLWQGALETTWMEAWTVGNHASLWTRWSRGRILCVTPCEAPRARIESRVCCPLSTLQRDFFAPRTTPRPSWWFAGYRLARYCACTSSLRQWTPISGRGSTLPSACHSKTRHHQ